LNAQGDIPPPFEHRAKLNKKLEENTENLNKIKPLRSINNQASFNICSKGGGYPQSPPQFINLLSTFWPFLTIDTNF